MKVSIHLHTILQTQTPNGMVRRVDLVLREGSTVADVLMILGVPMEADSLLIAVNGRVADIDHLLINNDEVNIMPAISGG